jgi:hypothetical protein
MKTSVAQSLVDKGDPLALSMVAEGASTFKMVPVSEWKYYIYKVTYSRDEKMQHVVKTGYIVATDTHVECDVERHAPNDCWMLWELVEGFPRRPSYFYDTIEELKEK